jgi:hypothetical protein
VNKEAPTKFNKIDPFNPGLLELIGPLNKLLNVPIKSADLGSNTTENVTVVVTAFELIFDSEGFKSHVCFKIADDALVREILKGTPVTDCEKLPATLFIRRFPAAEEFKNGLFKSKKSKADTKSVEKPKKDFKEAFDAVLTEEVSCKDAKVTVGEILQTTLRGGVSDLVLSVKDNKSKKEAFKAIHALKGMKSPECTSNKGWKVLPKEALLRFFLSTSLDVPALEVLKPFRGELSALEEETETTYEECDAQWAEAISNWREQQTVEKELKSSSEAADAGSLGDL